jgi:nucleoside-diphosphate-sugar epimerase
MEALRHLIITGASGFLGSELMVQARRLGPGFRITALFSPRQGGIDLSGPNCAGRLAAELRIDDPAGTVLVHAAAVIQAELDPSANERMAMQLAHWANSAGIGFSVMVSSVSVYAAQPTRTPVDAPTQPPSMYGLDKLNAERVWQRELTAGKMAIVRLAGVWGWQRQSTLFWNRLLLAAGRGSPPESIPVVLRKRSLRNYISAAEASECIVQLATNGMAGKFLVAGRDSVNTESFVHSLQQLPGSRLAVQWRDDGISDECLYSFSPEIAHWLQPFESALSAMWAAKPGWLLE